MQTSLHLSFIQNTNDMNAGGFFAILAALERISGFFCPCHPTKTLVPHFLFLRITSACSGSRLPLLIFRCASLTTSLPLSLYHPLFFLLVPMLLQTSLFSLSAFPALSSFSSPFPFTPFRFPCYSPSSFIHFHLRGQFYSRFMLVILWLISTRFIASPNTLPLLCFSAPKLFIYLQPVLLAFLALFFSLRPPCLTPCFTICMVSTFLLPSLDPHCPLPNRSLCHCFGFLLP